MKADFLVVRTWDEPTCDWFVVMLELDVVTVSVSWVCKGSVAGMSKPLRDFSV